MSNDQQPDLAERISNALILENRIQGRLPGEPDHKDIIRHVLRDDPTLEAVEAAGTAMNNWIIGSINGHVSDMPDEVYEPFIEALTSLQKLRGVEK